MENKNVNYLVLGFVFLIIGIALIGTIASEVNNKVDRTVVVDESNDLSANLCVVGIGGTLSTGLDESVVGCNITVTNYPTDWKVSDCPLTDVVVGNSTLDFTEGTDYNLFASRGMIQMLNTSISQLGYANTTVVDYTYCADDYLNTSWGRSVLVTVPGFFALALLSVALWLFYAVFRNSNLLNK